MLLERTRINDFEIVFGFVAPLGINVDVAQAAFEQALRLYKYESRIIRLSGFLNSSSTTRSIRDQMDAGDRLRAASRSGDVLAAQSIALMLSSRGEDRRVRRAWLLRTLKHDHEVRLLREVFGSRLTLVALSQNSEARLRNVLNGLNDQRPGNALNSSEASALLERDELDQDNEYGQRVREAFSGADFFIDMDGDVQASANRVVGLLFGEPYITPTRDEQAMFHAHAAALRSADPGRQVGAVIASHDGDVLAIGTNEVPKVGGGEFWENDDPDLRDFQLGHDPNKRQIGRVLHEVLDILSASKKLSDGLNDLNSDERFEVVWRSMQKEFRDTRALSLIEFGRVVHAEMSALIQAARLGRGVRGQTLYVTAFPCHMCMRLVLNAGVSRVVYVAPYPKSLALDMYGDQLTTRPQVEGRLLTEAFVGASWNVFGSVFSKINRERDQDGKFLPHAKETARYRRGEPDPLLESEALENQTVYLLNEILERVQNGRDQGVRSKERSRHKRIARGLVREGLSKFNRKIKRDDPR